jgi:hypothetical protein
VRLVDLQLTLSNKSAIPIKANALPDWSAVLYLPPKLYPLADHDALFPGTSGSRKLARSMASPQGWLPTIMLAHRWRPRREFSVAAIFPLGQGNSGWVHPITYMPESTSVKFFWHFAAWYEALLAPVGRAPKIAFWSRWIPPRIRPSRRPCTYKYPFPQ